MAEKRYALCHQVSSLFPLFPIMPTPKIDLLRSGENHEILKHGKNICLIGTGSTVKLMLDASEAINRYCGAEVTVIDLRFIKPIDFETIKDAAMSHDLVITAEESSLTGGIGEAIAAFANNLPCSCKVTALGAPDKFIHHARRKEQWEECGMSVDNILRLCSEYEA